MENDNKCIFLKGGIVYIIASQLHSEKDAEDLVKESQRIKTEDNPQPPLAFIDVRNMKLSDLAPYRKYFAQSAKIGDSKKAALVCDKKNPFFDVYSKFVFSAGGMMNIAQNVKFFTSEKEAIAWLKE